MGHGRKDEACLPLISILPFNRLAANDNCLSDERPPRDEKMLLLKWLKPKSRNFKLFNVDNLSRPQKK